MSAPSTAAPTVPRRKIGRPRVIESPEEMDRRLDEYLELCAEYEEPVTIMGMVLHMGFVDRNALDEYEKRDGFSRPVKRAKAAIALSYELRLDRDRPTGAIFALKNMGWSDQQTIEVRGVLAGLDMNRLTDEQLARIGAGEPVLAVLASAAERAVLALPAPAEPEEPKTPAP